MTSHPLQNTWTFWEHRKYSAKNSEQAYGQNMFEIGDFSTVEDFWRFKNNLPQPSDIFFTQSSPKMKFADREVEGYSLFKKGIRPEWEDPSNKHGGELFCRKNIEGRDLDMLYETLLLGMIGETIDSADDICGCRIVDKSRPPRSLYRIELWYKRDEHDVREGLKKNVEKVLRRSILTDHRSHSSQSYKK